MLRPTTQPTPPKRSFEKLGYEHCQVAVGYRMIWIGEREMLSSGGTHQSFSRKGGYSHLLASTLSLRAVGLATLLSHKCDILSLLKDDQIVRNNRVPVHCRQVASRRHHTVIPVATQMSLPPVCLPLFKHAQGQLRDRHDR